MKFKSIAIGNPKEFRTTLDSFADCLLELCDSSIPTVALVQGRTQGGGVGLAATCDLVLAEPTAKFALPEALAGLMPSVITPVLLRRMTPARVRSMALSTRTINAKEALGFGLIDEVTPERGLASAGKRQIRRLLCSSPAVLKENKRFFEECFFGNFKNQVKEAVVRGFEWFNQAEAQAGLKAAATGELPPWWAMTDDKRGSQPTAYIGVANEA